MSANDDDRGGDDDKLDQLRSVWVSMRESDEDPPDRGLDALMAAARTKAADMSPPASEGFWTKVLAVFRRPPVLALASITVLLGGALFIAQRRDTMQSEISAVDRAAPAGSAAAPPPTHEYAPAAPPTAAPAIEAPTATPIEIARDPDPAPRTAPSRRPGAGAPPVRQKTAEPQREESPAKKGAAEKGVEDDGIEDTIETETAGGLKQAGQTSATRAPGQKATTTAPESDSSGRTDAKPSMDEAAPTSNESRAGGTQVMQLVKQCESAAARNDCAAVRVLAKRIKSADAAAYQQRVAKNAAIARCLE